MRKILITGGNGFIGSHLADKLSEKYQVYIFDNKENRIGYIPPATFLRGDIKNIDDINRLFPKNLEGVIHLAAVSRVIDGNKDPVECMHIGVVGTMNVLEFVRRSGSWFILGSTNEASHNNFYGLTKHTQELCAERYSADYDVKSLVLKFASVYGSDRDQRKIIPTLIEKARKGKEIVIENGLREQDFINVIDIVEGICLGVKYVNNVGPGYFERIPLCSGRTMKDKDLAREIIRDVSSHSNLIIKSEKPVIFPKMDPEKAERILGFRSQTRPWAY